MASIFPAQLDSRRLLLRRLKPGDAAALCGYRSLPEVARFQSWERFELDDARRLIDSQTEAEPGVPGAWFQLAVVEKSSGQMIGDCGLFCRPDDPRQMELGITLAPPYQGRGLATESVEWVLEFVFGTMKRHRVAAITDAENEPAAALFRRLGFRQEAHLVENVWFKGRWGSELVFALLRCEWEARIAAIRSGDVGAPVSDPARVPKAHPRAGSESGAAVAAVHPASDPDRSPA